MDEVRGKIGSAEIQRDSDSDSKKERNICKYSYSYTYVTYVCIGLVEYVYAVLSDVRFLKTCAYIHASKALYAGMHVYSFTCACPA